MPLQATSGAASYDGFGGGVAAVPTYIEDVFSTYLYTGTGASQTITNGIDLSTKGGLIWTKTRSGGAGYDWHVLVDSARGVTKVIETNLTDAEATQTDLTSFTTTGYNLAAGSYYGNFNFSGAKFVSWTFRKQPKFFDVVTWTGDDVIGRQIAHNLGSVPGCIMVKQTNNTRDWVVYHTSIGNTKYLTLNSTGGAGTQSFFNNTTPTSTVFTVGDWGAVNGGGNTYVAYLFAHNAGGFGLTGTDNVISCGSFTTDSGGNATVSLGYEPAWVMFKCSSNAGQNWEMIDTMRGWSMSTDVSLQANSSAAEAAGGFGNPTATGFVMGGQGNTQTYIYIAIRRGPMKVPTSGTDVFLPKTRTGNGTAGTVVSGASWPMDMLWISRRTGGGAGVGGFTDIDRLRGASLGGNNPLLRQNQTDAEDTSYVAPGFAGAQTSYDLPSGSGYGLFNTNAVTYIDYLFRRSPAVFDQVCYTGNSTIRTLTHNLGVAPQWMIVRRRNLADSGWCVYSSFLTATSRVFLQDDSASTTQTSIWNDTEPTSSVFTVGTNSVVNGSTGTYVAYLFATCAGVSKCGNYTGNGTTQTINCGFAAGVRFVIIKRTDDLGNWYVYDTARGMTVLTDPYLLMNATTAESATLGSVTTVSTGFAVDASILAAINTNGASYIYLAIA